jgi:hypothetical protein
LNEEKENTPERVQVKEDDEKVPLPLVAVRGGRARKAATAAVVSKAQGEI